MNNYIKKEFCEAIGNFDIEHDKLFFNYFSNQKKLRDMLFNIVNTNENYKNRYSESEINELYAFILKTRKKYGRKNYRIFLKQFLIKKYFIDNMVTVNKYKYTPIKGKLCYCIHHSLPQIQDGYATRSHYVLRSLSEKFDVSAITSPGYFDEERETFIDDLRYIRLKKTTRKLSIKSRYRLKIEAYKKIFLKEKPQFVIAASDQEHAIPILIAAKELGIPFYYEVRGLWEVTRLSKDPNEEKKIVNLFDKYFETKVCQMADFNFVITNAAIEELSIRGVDKNKMVLFPNCANINNFKPMKKDRQILEKIGISETIPVIGYIGTIQMYEGLDDLLRACKILKEKNHKFRLIIVGGCASADNDNYDEYLKKMSSELDIDDCVSIVGKVPPSAVPKYYSIVDIAPFGRKPLPVCKLISPIKPLEAMAMEKTVIISNLPALKELVIDNKTGLCFEAGNINSYAAVLEKVITDIELRVDLSKNARQWVKNNRQWQYFIEKVISILGD